ncbi:MAG: ParB/RepB/Spo0J family partition protein [Treponema sp.]|nr:ParB/RepB/Spo0J family partition protein [Treponema sp.]
MGLGKGLDALMGQAVEEYSASQTENSQSTEKEGKTLSFNVPEGISIDESGKMWVDPALLKPNPQQPRQEFSAEDLQELADSIKENGILQPPLIEDAGDGTFYIIAGERRTRAAKLAGLTKIPVQLGKFNEVKKLEVALIENIQRENLNPIDEARAYFKLMELGELSQDEVAKRVGKNRSTVANSLRLLKLPEDIQAALISGQISAGHARAILSVVDSTEQRILFGKIVGNGLSVRDAEQLAGEMNNKEKKPAKKVAAPKTENKDPNLLELEQKFVEVLGTKVQIKGDLTRGSIQIEYFSSDDLDRLYSIFIK